LGRWIAVSLDLLARTERLSVLVACSVAAKAIAIEAPNPRPRLTKYLAWHRVTSAFGQIKMQAELHTILLCAAPG